MNWTFIIILIVSILVVYLIFKLIKKVIFAILTVVLLFTLVIGGVFGLAYLDFKQLSEKQDFSVYLVYGEPGDEQYSLLIPVENQEINADAVQSTELSVTQDQLEQEETDFYVFISEEFYEEQIVTQEREYTFLGADEYNVEELQVNINLSEEEVQEIYDSNTPVVEFVDILVENNPDLEPLAELGLDEVIVEDLRSELEEREIGFKDALFASTIVSSIQQDETVVYDILRAYQEGDIEIYPERFSFKLLKLAPIGLVENLIPAEELSEDSQNQSS